VKAKIASLAACAAISAFATLSAAKAATTVVTFDTLPDEVVPDGYGGITWGGDWTVYSEVQSPYTPESPPARVYTFDADASFSFSAPEVFDGAYFSGEDDALVTFNLYDGATEVWTSTTLTPSSTPTFLASGYNGLVTRVVVASTEPDFYVMDNVTYGTGTATPEPATWAMMLLGFAGLGFAAYRRTRKPVSIAA
jgi:PEP-CTERM motif